MLVWQQDLACRDCTRTSSPSNGIELSKTADHPPRCPALQPPRQPPLPAHHRLVCARTENPSQRHTRPSAPPRARRPTRSALRSKSPPQPPKPSSESSKTPSKPSETGGYKGSRIGGARRRRRSGTRRWPRRCIGRSWSGGSGEKKEISC